MREEVGGERWEERRGTADLKSSSSQVSCRVVSCRTM
jgi:hypothetical protein